MSIKVEIYDQTYTVAGDLEPAYVEELAQYVDGKMREIARATGTGGFGEGRRAGGAGHRRRTAHARAEAASEGREELRERAERCLKLVERALQQSACIALATATFERHPLLASGPALAGTATRCEFDWTPPRARG